MLAYYNFEVGGINPKIIAGMKIIKIKKLMFLNVKNGPADVLVSIIVSVLRLLKYNRTMIIIGKPSKDKYSLLCT